MIDVVLTRKRMEAEDIFSFEFASADGSALPPFSAGSHIDVHLNNGLVRQYSLCNNPAENGRYLLGVLRDPASRGGSIAMHALQEGMRLRVSAPRNLFALEKNARRSLLMAGGIGITPILSMAERLADEGAEFVMHYCARSPERMAFRHRIETSSFSEKAHFHFDTDAAENKINIAALLSSQDVETHLYVCGPLGFIHHTVGAAEAMSWPAGRIHLEHFGSPIGVSKIDDTEFTIGIASTGQTFPVPGNLSVMQVLAMHGIDIPVSCEQGICGTCITNVLDGIPDHRDMFLTDQEHALNDRFTPCCSRSKSKLLLLDL